MVEIRNSHFKDHLTSQMILRCAKRTEGSIADSLGALRDRFAEVLVCWWIPRCAQLVSDGSLGTLNCLTMLNDPSKLDTKLDNNLLILYVSIS